MQERDSHEHLSALMDGELGPEPARFLLRRMEHDPDLARAWSRWHLVRACLAERSPSSPHADPLRIAIHGDDEFSARVLAALRAQPQARRHWARYLGGGAIAAGVAAAALVLSVPQSISTSDGVAGIAGHSSVALAPATSPVATLASRIAATPASRDTALPWLDRRPLFPAARPGDAGSVLSGNYLQQAAYAPDSAAVTAPMLMRAPQQQVFEGSPYLILLVPDQNAQPQAASRH